jgi:cation-transporting ATPase E
MDKTGTLTTNRLRLVRVVPLTDQRDEASIRALVALFATCSIDRDSKSLQAIRAALGESPGDLLDQLPFKSQNRYSAVRVRGNDEDHVLVLGAFEALQPLLTESSHTQAIFRELSSTGFRLLVFTNVSETPRETFGGSLDGYRLQPLALIALSDDMRSEAPDVLRAFAEQGIRFKILSGDNPDTVRATVAPLGENADSPALAVLASQSVVTGAELEAASDPGTLLDERSVFGRVSPWQKVQIIRALTAKGHKVAMIGDGVNDVLPIKNASLGIAMGDGSRASKTVAGVVLQTNDFGLLPRLLDEGRMIVRNLRRSGKLFLTKNVYFLLIIIAALGIFNFPFPIAPQQVTLLNFLTIGVPALLITLDRSKAGAARGDFVREVGWFAVRTGIITGFAALGMQLVTAYLFDDDETGQRTMVLTTLVLLGWVTLWRAMGSNHPATLLRWLPMAGLVIYLLALYVPPIANFFELVPLSLARWGLVLVVVVAGAIVMWASDEVERLVGARQP